MLDTTKTHLKAMFENHAQIGLDGQPHPIDHSTRVSALQGAVLADLHRQVRPEISVEVGMAYGFSSLFLLDSMHEHKYGFHVAVDPFQKTTWSGIGMKSVQLLGFTQRFKLLEDMSTTALTRLNEQGLRTNYVFIDGLHTFDAALVDFHCADRILDVGGLIIFDDMWMPSIRKVASFIRSNVACYREIETQEKNIFCIQKQASDQRSWDHYVDF